MRQTLKKHEILSSRKVIEELFESGESTAAYPVRAVYRFEKKSANCPVQVAFSVPKKSFKRAVDRNRIKRLMREAYRKNKEELHNSLQQKAGTCCLMLIYTGKEELPYAAIENKIIVVLLRLIKENEVHF